MYLAYSNMYLAYSNSAPPTYAMYTTESWHLTRQTSYISSTASTEGYAFPMSAICMACTSAKECALTRRVGIFCLGGWGGGGADCN